jgi:hypothetical protein
MSWSYVSREEVPEEVLSRTPPRPRRRTTARKQADYERHLRRWGSHAEAAARTGIDARTSRRWREEAAFARRCEQALAEYRQIVMMEVSRRMRNPEYRPIWHRGRQIGHLRRFNDRLMLRLIARLPVPAK